jgi:hypothetical protein
MAFPAASRGAYRGLAGFGAYRVLPWVLVGGASLLLGVAAGRYGLFTLYLWYPLACVWALAWPRSASVAILAVYVALGPVTFGHTEFIAFLWYQFPPEVERELPLTIDPGETLMLLTALSLALRPMQHRPEFGRIPLLVWTLPAWALAGLAYGLWKGGDGSIAYHESRGLLFAAVAFFIAVRCQAVSARLMLRMALVATGALAVIDIERYLVHGRGTTFPVGIEGAFPHEDVIFLALGFMLSGAMFLRTSRATQRGPLLLHSLLMIAATMMTARRSGTLVIIVAGFVMLWLVFGRRPVLVTVLTIVLVALGSIYLRAYWYHDYGALAQPARAVRSQFDPSVRDANSDIYRAIERFNVTYTIRFSPLFGVGFGRPFSEFIPMVDVRNFWGLQQYTPHINILFLWLKMGIVGMSACMGAWVLAMSRSLRAFRVARRHGVPAVELFIPVALCVYLAFSYVDLVLLSSRALIPLAIAMAVAYMLPDRERRETS